MPGTHFLRGRRPCPASRGRVQGQRRGHKYPVLQALLAEPDFIAGNLTTAFIEERPGLLNRGSGADRGTRLLNYMADVTVNRPNGPAPAVQDPKEKLPAYVLTVTKGRGKPGAPGPVPDGSRQLLDRLGPDGFARWLRQLAR